MTSKYKIVFIITALLIILSLSLSIINYVVSFNNAQNQLKTQSLPLSLDNIYTDIQKHIIEPYLVSSMMANDTFVQDWLKNKKEERGQIIKYLEAIKNKYGMFNTFIVSDRTKNYYTQKGFIEKLKEDDIANKWYSDFKAIANQHEINLDFNEHLSNELIMFINYKILDSKFHFLGVTGVALKLSYIDDLLKNFRINHHLNVTFFDKKGEIRLAERVINQYRHIDEIKELKPYKDLILSKNTKLIEYTKNGSQHLIDTKYISELDLYLTVEANVDDFTKDVKKIFYINIVLSLVMAMIIALLIYFIIKKYSERLEFLSNNDTLTQISNRRGFKDKLNSQLLLQRRLKNTLSVIFIDIDNFKKINDKFGHNVGDQVLQKIAQIFKDNIRHIDLIARWGGEEFIIVLINSSLEDSKKIAEKLRNILENNQELKNLTSITVTGSFGLTQLKEDDSLDRLIDRADNAMYQAKNSGKNKICVL